MYVLQSIGSAVVQQPEYVNELSSSSRQSLRVSTSICLMQSVAAYDRCLQGCYVWERTSDCTRKLSVCCGLCEAEMFVLVHIRSLGIQALGFLLLLLIAVCHHSDAHK